VIVTQEITVRFIATMDIDLTRRLVINLTVYRAN
jgi:hypothetical protein